MLFKTKLKLAYSCLWETHHRAAERHLPHGITLCHLPSTHMNMLHL